MKKIHNQLSWITVHKNMIIRKSAIEEFHYDNNKKEYWFRLFSGEVHNVSKEEMEEMLAANGYVHP